MNVQYLSNEKGGKIAAVVPIKDWEKMQEQLKLTDLDFWETLPNHVKDGINKAQKQSSYGDTKTHDEVMEKYSKYL